MPFTAADLASQLERNAGAMPAMAAAVTALLLAVAAPLAGADDPYRYFTWTVTYGPISPLGTTQQVYYIASLSPYPPAACNACLPAVATAIAAASSS